MRLSNNANDFRAAVEEAQWRFNNRKLDWMNRHGPQFAAKALESKESILEHHLRIYYVDEILRALNWSLSPEAAGEPNLLAELPIISPETGTTKFIDYLGLEAATATPLLLVETKRYGSPLPVESTSPYADVPAFLARALAGKEKLPYYWPDWMNAVGE